MLADLLEADMDLVPELTNSEALVAFAHPSSSGTQLQNKKSKFHNPRLDKKGTPAALLTPDARLSRSLYAVQVSCVVLRRKI